VRAGALLISGAVTKDLVTGNGRVTLGRLASYGDVAMEGRGILRLSSFANRSLKLNAISFVAQVLGTKADKFSVLVNDQVVYQVVALSSNTNINIDLTPYMLAGKCFVIELRGERYEDVTDSMSIDDLTVEGEKVEEDGDAGPKQCWQRTLDLTNTLAFYGFDYGSSRPTYANALVSPSSVVDLFGHSSQVAAR
jgi:hypothetical protein